MNGKDMRKNRMEEEKEKEQGGNEKRVAEMREDREEGVREEGRGKTDARQRKEGRKKTKKGKEKT